MIVMLLKIWVWMVHYLFVHVSKDGWILGKYNLKAKCNRDTSIWIYGIA
jgi:hypothetical protein